MTKLAHLAQRLFNVPLMIEPRKAEIIVCALQERLGVVTLDRIDGTTLGVAEMQATASEARRSYGEDWKPYPMMDDVAVIEISGTLVHKYGYLDPVSGMTGYDGIARKLRAAMADDAVRAIWLDVDSPGGEVAGCFALADEIAASTKSEGGKPIWAYVNEQSCSAAYALTCVCDKVYAPADAVIGSIGAFVLHVDLTAALDKNGVKVTIVRAGDRKARTMPYEGLDPAAAEKLQDWVDETRGRFVKLVAAGRRLPVKAVNQTEADWYTANDALEHGLIDGILSETHAWAKLQRSLARG
jgi:capsid assembly protease